MLQLLSSNALKIEMFAVLKIHFSLLTFISFIHLHNKKPYNKK